MKAPAAAAALLLAACASPGPAAPDPGRAFADTDPVSCRLPPQIRRLHAGATILAGGRIVRTTAGDCRQRGGEARALPATAPPAPAVADGGYPVMVGGESGAPACAGAGTIAGLRTGQLNVRSGPGTTHPRIDGLGNGRRVHVCDGTADEAWLGIVYPANAGQDCGLDAWRGDGAAYRGPCRFGWVDAGWVALDAD